MFINNKSHIRFTVDHCLAYFFFLLYVFRGFCTDSWFGNSIWFGIKTVNPKKRETCANLHIDIALITSLFYFYRKNYGSYAAYAQRSRFFSAASRLLCNYFPKQLFWVVLRLPKTVACLPCISAVVLYLLLHYARQTPKWPWQISKYHLQRKWLK